MKNKLFILVIIIIIVIGIYIYSVGMFQTFTTKVQTPTIQGQERAQAQNLSSENMNSEQASTDEQISENVVNYTEAGFNPSSLEVKNGETVRFVNQSGGGMWVASGPHPTHTNYPEFDAKENIPDGETYEFTLTKIGEWKYHNHTGGGKTGMIIVK